MIKNIIFDLGGVIITLDQPQAIRRFQALGVADADKRLDAYTQGGIFGDLERGAIDADTFRVELGKLAGCELTFDECRHAWLGYCRELPQRNLDALRRLRSEGYRLILLSNTNPFMMSWAMSPEFDGDGHSIEDYMDACYCSYKLGVMKPDTEFFHRVLMAEHIVPSETLFVDDGPRNVAVASQMGIRTYCPENGADWTGEIYKYLSENER
ncbi:MAG: HAD family phosphatase [Prevotella sp.]|nr:HAD family phosphatase [Prevotella sp.]